MYLKKNYIYIYISIILLIVSGSIFSNYQYKKKDIKIEKKSIHKNILDSIEPPCEDINSKFYNSTINKININITESRKWNKTLFRALTAKSKHMILSKYKKRFDGDVSFYSGKNLCKSIASIRLSGGRKDHIEIRGDKIISSLDIHLKEGNINGITKFKLFLPKSRNHKSEVITSLILRELGFISPRTFLVEVNLNKYNHQMILQEKPAKEMIEYHNLRESALLGINNNLLYELRSQGNRLNDPFMSTIFPELINHKWAIKGDINSEIGFNAIKHFSNAFQKIWSKNPDYFSQFSDYDLSNNSKKSLKYLREFRIILMAMGAEHSLWNNNRRFYYDPFYNSLYPIYYDGNSKINENYTLTQETINILHSLLLKEIEGYNIKPVIKKVKDINKNRILQELRKSNVYLNPSEVKQLLVNIENNLNILKNSLEIKKINSQFEAKNIEKAPHYNYKELPTKFGIAFSNDGEKYTLCKIENKKCKKLKLKFDENVKLLNSKYDFENLNYYYTGSNYNNYLNGSNNKYKSNFKYLKRDNISFYYQGDPIIKIDNRKKILNLNFRTNKDKIVFSDTELKDWNIKVKSISYKQKVKNRFDNNLLTGLVTIKDSNLSNINIEIYGGIHEDSLNIMNSKGTINNIIVSNSSADAIDFDHSNLNVKNIKVYNAGNDCVDLSGGNYKIELISAEKCFDKGISVGENSKSIVDKLMISDVNIGFVSKDSSFLTVGSGKISNYKICSAAYRKKQEFNGSIIKSLNKICPQKDVSIQKHSYYIYK